VIDTHYSFAVNSKIADNFQGSAIAYSAQFNSTNATEAAKVQEKIAYSVPAAFSTSSNISQTDYGFKSDLSTVSGKTSYNFYAAGSAPNYFRGTITCSTDPEYGKTGIFGGGNNTVQGTRLSQNGLYRVSRDASNTSALFELQRIGATSGYVISFGQADTKCGHIRTTDDNGILVESDGVTGPVIVQNSDARVKTLTAFSGNAADIVQALNPGVNGFIAHELQAHVSEAVTGTQDATETYGTYTDTDGEVETNVAEPAVIPAGASFVAEGTRPVYQGVDQTKLIPILTKALQEALARIEALEAQLA